MEFELNLLKQRKAKGLKQREVALAVGVSVDSYRKWEQGTSKPNEANMKKLEAVMNRNEITTSATNSSI